MLFAASQNISMLTDFYEFTMVAGYFAEGIASQLATFDVFVRRLPQKRSFLVAAGLEQAIDYIKGFHFTPKDVDFILEQPAFAKYPQKEGFRTYLEHLRFTGTVRAVPEGTLVFAEEPLLEIIAPLGEAQLLETAILSILGHQTLIATKAAHVVHAAVGKPVIDFGARRAHGIEAAWLGSRACYIGGCQASSNVLAGQSFAIPVSGTQAHSWIQSFPDEKTAFLQYVQTFPDKPILLIDTYDIEQGAHTAVLINQELKRAGKPPLWGVRIDSGDLGIQSKKVRRILDQADQNDMKIVVSGDLNEDSIRHLLDQHAPIDAFGVGTEMMTSRDDPTLNIVYKLAELDGRPRMKFSEGKRTYPGKKQIFRKIDPDGSIFDTLGTPEEVIEQASPLLDVVLIGQTETHPRRSLANIQARVHQNINHFTKLKGFVISPMISRQIALCRQQLDQY